MSDPVSFHSQLAKSWSAKYRHGAFRARMQTFARAVEEVSAPGQRWLDAGCGTGELAEMLESLGRETSAIDASPDMIKLCRVRATVANVENLPYENETFDGIVCSSVLEYTESPGLALREFHRVLKPGSFLLVSVANSGSALRALQRFSYRLLGAPQYMQYSRHAFSREEFDKLLGEHGFTPRRILGFGPTIVAGTSLPFGYPLRLHIASKA